MTCNSSNTNHATNRGGFRLRRESEFVSFSNFFYLKKGFFVYYFVLLDCQQPEVNRRSRRTGGSEIARLSLSLSLSLCSVRIRILSTVADMKRMAEDAKSKAKDASIFWLQGFREACCLHRVFFLCLKSRNLLIRTGQCFLLNGFIFLGSLLVLKSVVIPMLEWILPQNCSSFSSSPDFCALSGVLKLYSFLHLVLIQLFYVLWFYPLYIFSLIISALWYGDIAKFGFAAIEGPGHMSEGPSSQRESVASVVSNPKGKPADLGRVVIGIGEQVYSILLLTFFFLEVSIIGYIPYIGKALSFLLLSWMYSYYCFEYKWNFSEVSLDKRLNFFQSNWAFFAGFGNPCVLAIFFFSPLVSYGVMAILFPLFVLTATSSRAEQVLLSDESKWGAIRLGRLPIFYVADTFSMWVLNLFSLESREQKQENKIH